MLKQSDVDELSEAIGTLVEAALAHPKRLKKTKKSLEVRAKEITTKSAIQLLRQDDFNELVKEVEGEVKALHELMSGDEIATFQSRLDRANRMADEAKMFVQAGADAKQVRDDLVPIAGRKADKELWESKDKLLHRVTILLDDIEKTEAGPQRVARAREMLDAATDAAARMDFAAAVQNLETADALSASADLKQRQDATLKQLKQEYNINDFKTEIAIAFAKSLTLIQELAVKIAGEGAKGPETGTYYDRYQKGAERLTRTGIFNATTSPGLGSRPSRRPPTP